jgi:chromosome segregation ATPase
VKKLSEQKLDLILNTLGQINGRLDKIEQRMDKMDQRIDKIEQRMDKIEQRIDKIEHRMDQIEQRIDKIEIRLDKIEIRLDTLESGQKELNQIVTAIRDRQEETDARLEALSMDVHRLVGEHTKNQSDIARHEKVLGLLSLSILEHKSDIDSLKSAG